MNGISCIHHYAVRWVIANICSRWEMLGGTHTLFKTRKSQSPQIELAALSTCRVLCAGTQQSVGTLTSGRNTQTSHLRFFFPSQTVGYLKVIFISNGRGFPPEASTETPGGKKGPKRPRIYTI